ncbi:ABC-2 type transport system permease protein [Halorubrum aquaticum]|uniref:ABC-2 type transport system permease protein n=1 Tax=Halorubrum aquaticum TaxID=387340 RepID=A0A1I2YXV5_9EURY|nr:ABC transporter permease subunit [Halorubrum aquaticum]SFH30477.1 ABC-2 type transport system permease protein [Halorubrum aquaticum]
MLETARYEVARRVRGTAFLSVGISLYAAFIVWYFTVLEGVAVEEVFEELPPAMMEAFGIETLSTIEGFLGAQIYNFVWLLGLGLYFAYAAGGLVANDVESGRMELLLSFPIARSRLLVEKFASLLVPIVVVNAVAGGVIYLLAASIGERLDATHLVLTHVLSVPYFLVCAAIGLTFSVAVDRAAVAERGAVGVVFVLFLVESVVSGAGDYDWIRYVSPTHYYEPTPLLIDGTHDPIDAGILLVAFLGLVLLSQVLFDRRDI